MRVPNDYHLRRWLAREVLGKTTIPRKPPQSERKGPPRDARYRAWIRTLPSAVSGKMGCEACHTGSDGGMSQKASDYSCVPLTPAEHREYHRIGKRTFEHCYRIHFASLVRRLNRIWRLGKTEAA